MARGDALREVRPIRERCEDLAPGEEQHRNVIDWNMPDQNEKERITEANEALAEQELAEIPHVMEEPCKKRREQDDDDAVEARDRSEEQRSVFAVHLAHIERQKVGILAVNCAVDGCDRDIDEQDAVFLQDAEEALVCTLLLIDGAFAVVGLLFDILDKQLDQER